MKQLSERDRLIRRVINHAHYTGKSTAQLTEMVYDLTGQTSLRLCTNEQLIYVNQKMKTRSKNNG